VSCVDGRHFATSRSRPARQAMGKWRQHGAWKNSGRGTNLNDLCLSKPDRPGLDFFFRLLEDRDRERGCNHLRGKGDRRVQPSRKEEPGPDLSTCKLAI